MSIFTPADLSSQCCFSASPLALTTLAIKLIRKSCDNRNRDPKLCKNRDQQQKKKKEELETKIGKNQTKPKAVAGPEAVTVEACVMGQRELAKKKKEDMLRKREQRMMQAMAER